MYIYGWLSRYDQTNQSNDEKWESSKRSSKSDISNLEQDMVISLSWERVWFTSISIDRPIDIDAFTICGIAHIGGTACDI